MSTLESLQKENSLLRKQLRQAVEENERKQQIFLQIEDFSSRLGVPTKLTETYRNCLHLFQDLLTVDFASLFLKKDDQDTLLMVDTIGFSESIINQFVVKKCVGLPSIVLKSLQIETIEDFYTEERIDIPPIIFQNNIRSAIAVPMLHNKDLFGVIIGHSKNKRLFAKEEQRLSQIFANQAATAIKNAIHIQSLKQSDKALLESSNELQSIFQNSMAGILLLKGERIIANCNQRIADMAGYDSPEEMKGLNMRTFHPTEGHYQKAKESILNKFFAGKEIHETLELRKKDGSTIWCEIAGKALDRSIPPDLSKGIVYIANDISKRKNMEEQLLKGQKLESLAILTGGMGHDFNNIITAILGNIDLCVATMEKTHAAYTFLQPAKEATLKLKELTERLLMLSQPSKPVLSEVYLPTLIKEVAETISYDSVEMVFDFANDLKMAKIDPDQISQVLKHLFNNSISAIEGPGRISITCSNYLNNDENLNLGSGHYIKTTIRDSGHGIPAEILDSIFDPYFTTRGRSKEKGNGLGLATVFSIIKRHKGLISAKSSGNNGAIFTFYLPAVTDQKNILPVSGALSQDILQNRRTKKILLMDDDESVRFTTQKMLNLIGYQVETVVDGHAAIDCYQKAKNDGTPFDLVIMDLNIPQGMGAVDTIEKLLQLDPNATAVVASGDPMDSVLLEYQKYGFTGALSKPIDFAAIQKTLSITKC